MYFAKAEERGNLSLTGRALLSSISITAVNLTIIFLFFPKEKNKYSEYHAVRLKFNELFKGRAHNLLFQLLLF